MAAISKIAIRRAVRKFAGRNYSVRNWSSRTVDFAIDYRQGAAQEGDAELANVYLIIDTVAYAIRWAEMTGRYNSPLFEASFKDGATYIESIVRTVLRSPDHSVDFAYRCYREFAELYARHKAEAA